MQPCKMKRALGVSMKHVARAARVSVMTVSLALRHDPRIPNSTQERIRRVAERIGYRKNPLVAAHMASLRALHPHGREANVIAYVEPVLTAIIPQTVFTLDRFRHGASQGAEINGYRLDTFPLGEGGLSEARLLQTLAARGIRGVVFAPFLESSVCLTGSWERYALATIGYSLKQPRLHRAVNHHANSVRLTALTLMALGYRRIGLVLSRNENDRTDQGWLASFLLLRHQCAKGGRKFPLLLADRSEGQLFEWLRRENPDCVVSPDGGLYAILRGFRLRNGRVPGFACLHLNASCVGCSGIDQNNERVGGAAVELIVEQLHRNSYGVPADPKTVLIEGSWVNGSTTPAVTSASTATSIRMA